MEGYTNCNNLFVLCKALYKAAIGACLLLRCNSREETVPGSIFQQSTRRVLKTLATRHKQF